MATDLEAQRIAHVEGASFSYRELGDGAPLVLLHGIGSGARSWIHQFAGLSSRFRVLAWDAPGYGGSTALGIAQPSASDYAASLVRWLDALNVERVHLVGHSLGTVLALRFAADYPSRVGTLTLASLSSGYAGMSEEKRKQVVEGRLADLAMLGPRGMAEKRGPRLLGPNASEVQKRAVIETMALIRPDGYRQAVRMLEHADTRTDLCRLPQEMPVQFVFGDADAVTTPESIRAIAVERPQAPVHVIFGTGHALYIEQPDEFNGLLSRFAEANR